MNLFACSAAPSTNSQLAWSWVEQQLTDAETYWVDVAGSGARPHAARCGASGSTIGSI